MLPPGAFVWRGRHGSWAAHLKPWPRISRSWAIQGHKEALLHVLRGVWRLWLVDNFLTTDDCPIAGLFEPSGASAASSSGGAAPKSAAPAPKGGAAPAPAAAKAALAPKAAPKAAKKVAKPKS